MLQTITSIINTEQSVVCLPPLAKKRVLFDPSGALFSLHDD